MRKHIDFEDKNLLEKGFTLVELLVVIVILGILAGVAVFAVSGITDKGKSSSCRTEVSEVQTAVEAYRAADMGTTPNSAPVAASVSALSAELNSKGLLASDLTNGATKNYSPSYSNGVFTANCP